MSSDAVNDQSSTERRIRVDWPTIAPLADHCLFAMDASALLHTWRMQPDKRTIYRKCLDYWSPRIFVPYQVFCEVEREAVKIGDDRIGGLESVVQQVHRARRQFPLDKIARSLVHYDFPLAARRTFNAKCEDLFQYLLEQIRTRKGEYASDRVDATQFLSDLREMEWWIGNTPTSEQQKEREIRAHEMVRRKVPPAVADNGNRSPEQRRLGDCLIWLELLELAAWRQTDIIFVTQDLKDRGWFSHGRDGTIETNRDLADVMMREVGVRFVAIDSEALIVSYEQRHKTEQFATAAGAERDDIPVIRPFKLFTDWDV